MRSCKTVTASNDMSTEAEDTVGIHYLAMTVEDTEVVEDLVCAIVRS
jgi:hypothetical protein